MVRRDASASAAKALGGDKVGAAALTMGSVMGALRRAAGFVPALCSAASAMRGLRLQRFGVALLAFCSDTVFNTVREGRQ